jgi:hypothetical protein
MRDLDQTMKEVGKKVHAPRMVYLTLVRDLKKGQANLCGVSKAESSVIEIEVELYWGPPCTRMRRVR